MTLPAGSCSLQKRSAWPATCMMVWHPMAHPRRRATLNRWWYNAAHSGGKICLAGYVHDSLAPDGAPQKTRDTEQLVVQCRRSVADAALALHHQWSHECTSTAPVLRQWYHGLCWDHNHPGSRQGHKPIDTMDLSAESPSTH